MFFPGQFTSSQSSPPVRNATYLRTFFSEFIYVFREILSTSMFFYCSIYIETAQNSRRECNEFADFLFRRLSLCLSRDSLSCLHQVMEPEKRKSRHLYLAKEGDWLTRNRYCLYISIDKFWCDADSVEQQLLATGRSTIMFSRKVTANSTRH